MEFLQDLWSLSKTTKIFGISTENFESLKNLRNRFYRLFGIFSLVTYLIRIFRIFRLLSQKTVIRPSAPTPSPHCSQLERLAAVNIPAWRKLHKIQADFYRFFKSCMLCTFFHFNAFVWLQFKNIANWQKIATWKVSECSPLSSNHGITDNFVPILRILTFLDT